MRASTALALVWFAFGVCAPAAAQSAEDREWGLSVDLGLDYLGFNREITRRTTDSGGWEHESTYSMHNGSLFLGFGGLYTQYVGLKGTVGFGANGYAFKRHGPYHGGDLAWLGIEANGYIPLGRYLRFQGGVGFASIDLGHVADNSCGANCTVLNPSSSNTTSHDGMYLSAAILLGSLNNTGSGWVGGPFLSVGYAQHLVSEDLRNRIFVSFTGLAWAP